MSDHQRGWYAPPTLIDESPSRSDAFQEFVVVLMQEAREETRCACGPCQRLRRAASTIEAHGGGQ